MGQRQRVIDGFRRVAAAIEDHWDVEVLEVDGWTWRGANNLYPRGFVNHHTAAGGNKPAPALGLVIDGSSRGIPGPLANFHTERGPRAKVRIIASGIASHAGKGSWPGCGRNTSRYTVGNEWENSGVGEKVHPDSDRAQMALNIEIHREFATPIGNHVEHREWARYGQADDAGPWRSRKIDRTEYRGPTWRARMAAVIAEGARREAGKEDIDMAWEFWQGKRASDGGNTPVYLVNTSTGAAFWVRSPAAMADAAKRLEVPTAVHQVDSKTLESLLGAKQPSNATF